MATEMRRFVLAAGLLLCSSVAMGHGESHDGAKSKAVVEQTPFGIAGDRSKATRRVTVDMSDGMRFAPSSLTVKRGETVRFVVRNRGAQLHEMVLGTPAGLAEHAALMRRFPDMEHDAPYMTHVKPGASGEIVWRFNRAGAFQFGCLVPGHFEAGMKGSVTVQ